jgi:3-hydroxyacyl-[acyl-carrier-protein] dehydratase
MTANTIIKLDEAAIRQLIPHRHPFLFITDAEIQSADGATGSALWPAGHPILSGHFPGLPIVPGVCQAEAAAQLAAVAASHAQRSEGLGPKEEMVGVLASIRKVLYHAPLFPDQTLRLSIKLKHAFGMMAICTGNGFHGDTKILSFELGLGIVPRNEVEQRIAESRKSGEIA